jgi:hypothetical protein
MKMFYYLLVIASLSLVSCTDCTWVQTGYYYDCDGDYVEEGYYDCPEENPVSYEIIRTPKIDVEFKSRMQYSTKENHHQLDFTIINSGNANAIDIKLNFKISRPNVFDWGEKKIEFERNIDIIQSNSNKTTGYSFRDISYTGRGLYDAYVNIEFKDEKGKSHKINKYFSF